MTTTIGGVRIINTSLLVICAVALVVIAIQQVQQTRAIAETRVPSVGN